MSACERADWSSLDPLSARLALGAGRARRLPRLYDNALRWANANVNAAR